jgi:hypothetical protein
LPTTAKKKAGRSTAEWKWLRNKQDAQKVGQQPEAGQRCPAFFIAAGGLVALQWLAFHFYLKSDARLFVISTSTARRNLATSRDLCGRDNTPSPTRFCSAHHASLDLETESNNQDRAHPGYTLKKVTKKKRSIYSINTLIFKIKITHFRQHRRTVAVLL